MLSKDRHFVHSCVENRLSIYIYILYFFIVCEMVIFVLVAVVLRTVLFELLCRTFEIP